MPTITTLDVRTLKDLAAEIDEALASVGARHGLEIRLGRGSYTPACATFKLQIATVRADGAVQDKDAEMFRLRAVEFGLDPNDLRREFTMIGTGRRFRIVGLKPRCKLPVIAEEIRGGEPTGKRFKFSGYMIAPLLRS